MLRRVGTPGQRRAATVRATHAAAYATYRSVGFERAGADLAFTKPAARS